MIASSVLDNSGAQVALITGCIGLFSIILTAAVKKIFDKPEDHAPNPPAVTGATDRDIEALRQREPALLALVVDLKEQVESAKRRADEANDRAIHAEHEAQSFRDEAKRWQDEVLRLQHLVEGLIERGRSS